MNQIKTGNLLKGLRKEKNWTQEQLAEMLNVSNRSVSRWENGKTLPDFDLILQLSELYEISIEEILDGKRKETNPDEKTLSMKTAQEIALLTNQESLKRNKIIHYISLIGILGSCMSLLIQFNDLSGKLADFCTELGFGLSLGACLVSFIFTSKMNLNLAQRKKKVLSLTGRK